MKALKSIAKVSLLTMVFVTMIGSTVFAGTSKPADDSVWNLGSWYYEFSGYAEISDLYTNYYLTGANSVIISVTNSGSNSLVVKLFKKDAVFATSTVTVPAYGTTTWTVYGLSSSSKYYLKFYAPCNFYGAIYKNS